MIETRLLHYFLAIAREQSITQGRPDPVPLPVPPCPSR